MNYLFDSLTYQIKNHNRVVIMTHKNPDLDGVGSAICLYEVVKSFKKEAYVVLPNVVNKSLDNGLKLLIDNKISVDYVDNEKALKLPSEGTLLVVLDTQKPELVECEKLLDLKDIFVIDHHVNSSLHISNTMFEYIDSNKSSIVEIMTNYLKYLDILVDENILTLMLAGMDIDTHSFSLKTSDDTFLAASFLTKNGAKNEIKNEILKISKEEVIRINNYVKKSYFIRDGFLLCDMDRVNSNIEVASLADELLRLSGVQVSFALGKIDDTIYVSARSMGKISVNVIMSAVGGGGHITDAAATFKNKTSKEVIEMLKKIVMEV